MREGKSYNSYKCTTNSFRCNITEGSHWARWGLGGLKEQQFHYIDSKTEAPNCDCFEITSDLEADLGLNLKSLKFTWYIYLQFFLIVIGKGPGNQNAL